MNNNLTIKILAICAAISLPFLASTVTAKDLTELQKSATSGIFKEIEQGFKRDCKLNNVKACAALADGYASKQFIALTEDGINASFVMASIAYQKACTGGIQDSCIKRVKMATKEVELCNSGKAESCFILGAASTLGITLAAKGKPDHGMAFVYHTKA